MGHERVHYLLKRYVDNCASGEEIEEMFALLRSAGGETALKELVIETFNEDVEQDLSGEDWDRIWQVVNKETVASRRPVRMLRVWRVAAAVLLVAAAGAVYWALGGRENKSVMPVAKSPTNDVAPGGNKAMLTLANGSTIVLDSAHAGVLTQQGGTNILKLNAGALAYNAGGNEGTEVMYNTIATPNGGQYQVILPDGSKVWLNAGSSLRFPTRFTGKERSVELTGEAYFDIANDKTMPFRVKLPGNGMDVQVLGTEFDVMAYANEQSSHTTLVSGKVNVISDHVIKALEPGKQAVLDKQSRDMRVTDANVEQVVAWKNGMFRFRETGIRELMRQVERWYNVEVVYETEGKDQDFTGVVSRNQPVSALLQTLELTGTVHFRVEGKKIIVLP
ncbi:MAG: FecR domain-containing protein [Chitinophagaceae bacterium]|nr:FecR domain-containing protein [Chitinophagaceae bacterium]